MLKSCGFPGHLLYLRLEMKFDRSVVPAIRAIAHPALPDYSTVQLDNGLNVYVLHFPESEILKVEVAFHAGRPEEQDKLAAYMTPRLMREGAGDYSAARIAEMFDFYGTGVTTWSWLDATGFILTGLAKYASETLPLFADILLRPAFHQAELENLIQIHIGELKVELEKVEVISYRTLTERLYGSAHPFGYNSATADYLAVTVDALKRFHHDHLSLGKAQIMVTGNITPDVIAVLNKTLGSAPAGPPAAPRENCPPKPVKVAGKRPMVKVKQPGALQTAVKMGRLLFNRQHPHFYEVQVLNTLFGGYFGSRLMTNIREEKGYTYNIYSGIDTYFDSGYLYVATEVNSDKITATIRAIRREMKKLREEPVQEEELTMVRNYMIGALLNGFDGPLNMSGILRAIAFEGIGKESFDRQMDILQTITPERIQELAGIYLQPEDYLTVVVG
jgi:zinc protease